MEGIAVPVPAIAPICVPVSLNAGVSNVLKVAQNPRILKLPPGVMLLKPTMGTILPSNNPGSTLGPQSMLRLHCVKSPEMPLGSKKQRVVLVSGAKQGQLMSSKGKEPPSVVSVKSESLKGDSMTAASGSDQNKEPSSTTTPGCDPNSKPKPKPWWREPRPLWKSREPIVMYSGCKPEDLEPKKKKEKPPESLPCPKKLYDILPHGWSYHICSFEELNNPENFKAEVRVNIAKKEEALQWLHKFESISGTNFRIAKTFKENSLRIIFKKCFKCHKNTFRKDRVPKRESKRHLGCEARLSITVKNTDMKSSADLLLAEFPCVIGIFHNHCHSLSAPDALRFRRPLPEVKEKLANMFRAKISPSAALRLHMADLKREFGDRYPEVVLDGARCPPLPWCYRLYYETVGKKVRDGKKKSARQRTYKKKTAITPRHAPSQILEESAPVIVNFNSVDGVSTSFTISMNNKHESEEVQRSINSLYEYEFMSKNNVVREDELAKNIQIVSESGNVVLDHNNATVCPVANSPDTEEILENEEGDDFIDNDEMLENDECVREFEEGCEILNSSATPNTETEMAEENVLHPSTGCRMEVDEAKQDLLRVLNDICSKLSNHPEKYLSAVKQFTSQYDKCCLTDQQSDIVTALNQFGSSVPSNLSLVSSNGVSSLVERLMDKGESSSVCRKPGNIASPKRKVLVLRMDPNRFNQILGKVGNKDSKREMVNI